MIAFANRSYGSSARFLFPAIGTYLRFHGIDQSGLRIALCVKRLHDSLLLFIQFLKKIYGKQPDYTYHDT